MSGHFEKKLKRILDADAARVDAATRNELARRRRAALETARRGPRKVFAWVAVGATAAAVLAMLLWWQPVGNQMPRQFADDAELDLEIVLAEGEFELYEDLEFFEWLAQTNDAG